MKRDSFRYRLDHCSRRDFLGQSACAGLGIGSMVNLLAQLQLVQSAASAAEPTDDVGDDYKALICLFTSGGMDANNLIIPIGTHPQATYYQDTRKQVAIPEADILSAGTTINPQGIGPDQYGLHPACTNLKNLFESGELAFMVNTGTLSVPTSKGTYDTKPKPLQLFSHSNQVQQWMSSVSDSPFTSGWGGRIAKYINDDQNPESNVSMLVTAAGNNNLMVSPGDVVPQYSVTTSGAVTLAGFGTNYANAVDGSGNYLNNVPGRRLKALERIVNYSHLHLFEEGYSEVVRRARINEALVGDALAVSAGIGVDFDAMFNNANPLAGQLKVISQLIAGRKCLNNKRQVFFCNLTGWDTHQNINTALPELLGQVDEAVGQFTAAMKALEVADADFDYADTMLFQVSDFNRTFTPNGAPGDQGAGTDHAWGTNVFVVGGAVEGNKFYGTYPDLRIGDDGTDSTPGSNRGRWIPTTSVDQYAAILADWLGVDRAIDLPNVLPNLDRFADPFDPANGLNFIDPLAG